MRSLRLFLPAIIALTAAISCSRVPDGVLPQEEMASLLADIYIGESVVEANTGTYNDSLKRAFRQSIYARHNVTSADVDSSLRWYGYNMERFIDVYDRTIEILNQRSDAARDRAGAAAQTLTADGTAVALEGDSVDVWNDIRFRPFSRNLPANVMPFLIKYDPNWEKGDIYTLRAKTLGNSRPVQFTAAIEYSDGTKETFSSTMQLDGWHQIRFATDTIKNAREIYGTIQYTAPTGETTYLDSISLTRTRHLPGSPATATARAAMQLIPAKRHSNRFD